MAVTHGGDIFAIARDKGWDWRQVLDFSASINPLGPSPRVREAICRAMDHIVHYPEREPVRLQRALAKLWDIQPEQILCGNGATELMSFLARVVREPNVTLAVPVFSEFHRLFPQARFADLLRPVTWPQEGLLVITRPANPTGWMLPLQTLDAYLSCSRALVIADESFIEFAGAPSACRLLERCSNLVILRSLTKFYGLPGLRLGALVGHASRIEAWRRQREPWQVNVLAEVGGLAAVEDEQHARETLFTVERERAWMFEAIGSLPLAEPEPPGANYLFVRLGYPAAALSGQLLGRKILIRNCSGWPGLAGECVRVAVRRRDENEQLIAAWKEFRCD